MKTSASFLINVVARVIVTIVSVFAGFFLSRYLGPEKYGIIGVYTTLLGFIPAVGSLGLVDSLGVNISKEGISNKLYSNGLIVITFLSLIFICLLILFRGTVYQILSLDFDSTIYLLLVIHIFFYFVNAYQEKVLEAISKSYVFSFVQIGLVMIRTLAVLAVVFTKQSFVLVLGLEFVITLSYVAVYWLFIVFKLHVKIQFSVPSFKWLKDLSKYGFSVYIAGLFFLFSQQLPILITQSLYGSAYVSYINIPLNLIARLFLPVLALSSVIAPLFGKIGKTQSNKNVKYFDYSLKLLLLIYVPIAMLFLSQPSQIITILYGDAYQPAGGIVVGLAIFVIFSSISTFLTTVIQYAGLAKSRLKNIAVVAVITAVMFLLGLNQWGFYSIPYTMSLSILFLTILDFVVIKKKIAFNLSILSKNFLIAIIASLPFYFLTFHLGVNAHAEFIVFTFIAGLIYLGAIYVFGLVSKDDLRLLINSTRGVKDVKTLAEDRQDNL